MGSPQHGPGGHFASDHGAILLSTPYAADGARLPVTCLSVPLLAPDSFVRPLSAEEQAELLVRYSPDEKQLLFMRWLGAVEEKVRSEELKLSHLELLEKYVQEIERQFESPTTWSGRIDKGLRFLNENSPQYYTFGPRTRPEHRLDEITAQEAKRFLEESLPTLRRRLDNGESLKEIAVEEPFLKKFQLRHTFPLSSPASEEELLRSRRELVAYYRSQKRYDAAEAEVFEVLGPALEKGLSAAEQSELRREAEDYVESLAKKHEAAWRNPSQEQLEQGARPMNDKEAEAFKNQLIEQRLALLRGRKAAQFFNPDSLHGEERRLWDIYNDMADPKSEWCNLADSTWDRIFEEVAINGALIAASGGTVALARTALSAGARIIASRIALHEAGTWAGSRITASGMRLGLQRRTVEACLRYAGKSGAAACSRLFDSAVYETTYYGLHGENFFALPDWGKRLVFCAAAFQASAGMGKAGERLLRKGAPAAGEAAVNTVLGDAVGKLADQAAARINRVALRCQVGCISNEAARRAAEQFLVKDNLTAAALLVIGALQNGQYQGPPDESIKDYAGQFLKILIVMNAVRVCRSGASVLGEKVLPIPKQAAAGIEQRLAKAQEEFERLAAESKPEAAVASYHRALLELEKETGLKAASLEEITGTMLPLARLMAASGGKPENTAGEAFSIEPKLRAIVDPVLADRVQAGPLRSYLMFLGRMRTDAGGKNTPVRERISETEAWAKHRRDCYEILGQERMQRLEELLGIDSKGVDAGERAAFLWEDVNLIRTADQYVRRYPWGDSVRSGYDTAQWKVHSLAEELSAWQQRTNNWKLQTVLLPAVKQQLGEAKIRAVLREEGDGRIRLEVGLSEEAVRALIDARHSGHEAARGAVRGKIEELMGPLPPGE